MRIAALAVAAMLFAGQAWAATWSVPGTHTLAAALAGATDGDTVLVAAGSHASLSPADAGVGPEPIVFVGSGSCTVADIVPKSHTRFYGFTVTDGVDMPANGKRVILSGCSIGGSLDYKDADSSSVRSCTVAGTSLTVNAGAGNMAQSDTLESCTFSGLSATSGFAIRYGITDAGLGYVNGFVRRFNTFAIAQGGSTAWTPAKHFKTSNMLSYANKFTITSTATGVGSNEGDFGMVFRDSSHTLTMRRDSLLFDNAGASFSTNGLLTSSGMGGAYASSLTGWAVDSCYFRVFNGTPVYLQAQTNGMRFRYNVLRSRLGTALAVGSAFSGFSNDPYMHHNTIMGNRAVDFSDQANTGGRVSNNIFWGTSSAACAVGTAVAGTADATPNAISDSNFVYSTGGDSTRAFFFSACASPRTGGWAGINNDTHSYWGSPAFTDTTWASLDVTPTAGSLAISSNLWTLGYAGASDGTVPDEPDPPAAPTYSDADDWFYARREDGL